MTSRIIVADVLDGLAQLADDSVHCVVTSPPYWGLRDYGVAGQLGLEATPGEHVAAMVKVFTEVRRVLKSDGTLWLNYGDCYAGSWGAQSRGNRTGDPTSTLEGGLRVKGREVSMHARQIAAHPRLDGCTGSLKRTPGLKPKDLVGMPWRIAFALQEDGWWLRSDIIWAKPSPMPESVTDRPTKAHEYLFLLTKSQRYYYDADAVRIPYAGETKALSFETMDFERRDSYIKTPSGWATHEGSHGTIHRDGRARRSGNKERKPRPGPEGDPRHQPGGVPWEPDGRGRNLRTVWTIASQPFPEAHFATFPTKLVEPCIKAGSPAGGVVLDPFCGSGTTGVVARQQGRDFVGIELNPEYAAMARRRIKREGRPRESAPLDLPAGCEQGALL